MRGKHGNHAKASRQHRWKPGGSVAHNGYVKTRVGKDHPLADANGYAYEHHVVWCAAGNPMLAIGQTLHHINGDKTDNRIANLRLMTRAEHNALHIREAGRQRRERCEGTLPMTDAKIVINACYGGFSLSREGVLRAREISGDPHWGGACIKGDIYPHSGKPIDYDLGFLGDIKRHDSVLVRVVEELGELANGTSSKLQIVTLPRGTLYRITEYDGFEDVETKSALEWEIAP